MYKLTDRMLQALEKDLRKFHELFQGGRCQAWQLEELIAKAIRSDFSKHEKVVWKGSGHDIGSDIIVNDKFEIQIKSGEVKKVKLYGIKEDFLILSGHRLGRFKSNLEEMTNFLNKNTYFLMAVPYQEKENELGKSHNYQILYIDTQILQIEDYTKWKKPNESYYYINSKGVIFSISPSMSWQIWWRIPLRILMENDKTRVISIN
ncbi:hypothetical protein ABSA28_00763 [Candidatus Hepatincolaceae symbiont of Richtersius coronifer]